MMSRQDVLQNLNRRGPVIAPSLLKCDFGHLQQEVEALESAGAGVLHWDVMDGHFVPNLSYGAMVIDRLRAGTELVFDAHLMIAEPARYLEEFLNAGCDSITIHYEAERNAAPLLRVIREAGRLAGLAINPNTPVEAVTDLLSECDLVLVMSVEPGFGGQKFQPVALEKLRQLRALAPPNALLSVDGGIGPETISAAAKAGANVFVVGSAIFEAADYQTALEELVHLAQVEDPAS